MKSWFNVSYVKLIICSQFRTPICPSCRVRGTKDQLISLYMNVEDKEPNIRMEDLQREITQKEEIMTNTTTELENLKGQNKQLRSVVNATCI